MSKSSNSFPKDLLFMEYEFSYGTVEPLSLCHLLPQILGILRNTGTKRAM